MGNSVLGRASWETCFAEVRGSPSGVIVAPRLRGIPAWSWAVCGLLRLAYGPDHCVCRLARLGLSSTASETNLIMPCKSVAKPDWGFSLPLRLLLRLQRAAAAGRPRPGWKGTTRPGPHRRDRGPHWCASVSALKRFVTKRISHEERRNRDLETLNGAVVSSMQTEDGGRSLAGDSSTKRQQYWALIRRRDSTFLC
jgi:hypothetical protein